MSHTYTRLLVHAIFSTKSRTPCLTPDIAERMHAYLGGIIRERGGIPIAVGGCSDHVHILVSLPATMSVSEFMRIVKAGSSHWMHETIPGHRGFAWQSGYAAFTVSPGESSRVEVYVRHQREHHRATSYQDEVRALLKEFGIELDERYAWD